VLKLFPAVFRHVVVGSVRAARSRTLRGSVGAAAKIAALRAALAAEQARYVAMEARWLAANRAVVEDAKELAALARATGVAAEVVDNWLLRLPR
jgi:hypothetical protein